MFRKLCGDSTLKNVVLVTNMWGKVEQGVAEARERELADIFFKPALDKQAQLARHYNTTQSSHDIIRRIMKNDPAPLRIQEELVEEGKNIRDTAAGEAIDEELHRLIKRHEIEMNDLREEMRQALREKDEETRRELEEETRKIRAQMDKMRMNSEAMESKYNEERRKMEETIRRMDEQARQERARIEAAHKEQMDELNRRLQEGVNLSAAERQELQQRIDGLQHQLNQRPNRRRHWIEDCLIM